MILIARLMFKKGADRADMARLFREVRRAGWIIVQAWQRWEIWGRVA